MTVLAKLFESARSPADYVTGYCARVAEIIRDIDADAVAETIETLEAATERGKSIFCIANGGSAAVASHFVNDMSANGFAPGTPAYRVLSLTDNVESVTAIANDHGYENVFLHQLRAHMTPGDVVLAMSVSGNSENILRGVAYANDNGGKTMAWTGFDGGRLAKMCHVVIRIPTTADEYGPVEGIFSHLAHIVSGYLTMKRGRKLSQSRAAPVA